MKSILFGKMRLSKILGSKILGTAFVSAGLLTAGVVMGAATPAASAMSISEASSISERASSSTDDERFLASLSKQSGLSADAVKKATSVFKEVLEDGGKAPEAASEALMEAFPKYREALDQVLEEQTPSAMESLSEFTSSKNKFLAADASFYLGRAYLLDRRHEEAEKSLQKVVKDFKDSTFRIHEAKYYLGTAQAGLLKTDEAIGNLVDFLQNSQNSPQRLIAGAYSQVVKLQKIKKGSLEDATNRMGYSQRRLEKSDADKETQTEQKKVVSILNKLIKEAEKKECSKCKGGKGKQKQSQKQGKKPGQGKGQGQKPGKSAGKSNIVAGPATRQVYNNGKIGLWAKLRERERDTANSGVKEKLPAEHRKLIEKFYKKMSEAEGLEK